jgi:hypothetical protein
LENLLFPYSYYVSTEGKTPLRRFTLYKRRMIKDGQN